MTDAPVLTGLIRQLVLAEIIDVNQVEADARQQQITLSAPEQLLICADSRLLARAIENVLRNAIKYGPCDSEIRCQLQVQQQQLLLTICDQGPGIAPDQLSAIFEPFYRTSSSRNSNTGGTGLGLAIVQMIVSKIGGRLELRNRPEGGLCALLLLGPAL